MKELITILFLSFLIEVSAQDFTEQEVVLNGIKGTLSVPSEESLTAILLISGSGPTDRDGNSALGLNNNSLQMVAHSLASNGFTVLRYDKRGIAESTAAIANRADLRFDYLVEDAANWLDFLRNEGFQKLIVAGHSQGSLVGMMASINSQNIAAFISIAGIADNAGDIMVRQLEAQSPVLAENAQVNIDSMRAGFTVKRYSPYLIPLFGPETQPFLKSYIAYTPVEEIQKLNIPVLIVNGTTDLQVGEDQAQKLKTAYPSAEYLIIEQMNHILKDAPLDQAENIKTYNNPDLPLSDGLMSGIISFIEKL